MLIRNLSASLAPLCDYADRDVGCSEANLLYHAYCVMSRLCWPNILIHSRRHFLSEQSAKGVGDSQWLIVERMYYSARTGLELHYDYGRKCSGQ
jgi:hypothetical protein